MRPLLRGCRHGLIAGGCVAAASGVWLALDLLLERRKDQRA